MRKPLVSIIISAYNHEKYVIPCLESMMNQTYENIELLLFNDGSTDGTHNKILSIMEPMKNRFQRVEYYNKENEGISKNFNLGIRMSKGDYIKTFASDDILMPNAVENLVDFLSNNHNYDIAYGDGYHVDSKKIEIGEKDLKEEQRFSSIVSFKSGDIHEYLYDILPHMSTWTVLFRKSCFNELGFYDENLTCEDMDLYLRFSKKYKFKYIDELLAIHRIHGENTGLNPNVMLTTFNRMLEKYDEANFFEKEDHRKKFIKLINWTERVLSEGDYSKLAEIEGRKIIGWGTGSYYQKHKEIFPFDIHYFVDSNPTKYDLDLDGKKIHPIEQLLIEQKEDIFIIIFSSFYDEIFEWLNDKGFQYKEHFY
ncbi:glycosyltransferase family 2 protein [Domibacillus enclensis]|uniref:Glycosyl transferase family 2 n=1 Tax=Domibacillus enclensis TaxID=1017273 RepID=A0A1N6SD22_9BACI|nr:glycosyltransferase [Domibacillus enclensis]OXS79290.1 hypothetical protein B1B05_05830 [Domibacillus enclensis]SIQ38971.1 Glycosyl transferase family 2 [Domibacillus enclensis]